jgi:hypothetical protein
MSSGIQNERSRSVERHEDGAVKLFLVVLVAVAAAAVSSPAHTETGADALLPRGEPDDIRAITSCGDSADTYMVVMLIWADQHRSAYGRVRLQQGTQQYTRDQLRAAIEWPLAIFVLDDRNERVISAHVGGKQYTYDEFRAAFPPGPCSLRP